MKYLSILSLVMLLISCKTTSQVVKNNPVISYTPTISSPKNYWQQSVDYKMEIDFNDKKHQYKGKQELVYTNNSPDELTKVYYHLYFNAFQPNSEMDANLQNIPDGDKRMLTEDGKSRIALLKDDEIGYIKINSLTQNGTNVSYQTVGTVLEVTLNKPIKSGEKAIFNMTFDGQVPLQIRRSGRDNKEGVAYSMTQWFPKMAEYDFEGWHADAYIAREFHGVWGNFDVKITIDKDYTIGGTGYLQNKNEIGHGYQDKGVSVNHSSKKLTWHFVAPNVHDFTWSADKDYIHDMILGENDVELHFIYKNDKEILENWKNLQSKTADLLSYFNEHIGKYPWKQYSVIQGGDGGMEYAMCTLITGKRKFGSLVGVTAHEMAHAWFQHLLATNEAKHEWMDEGMTSYISDYAMNHVMNQEKEDPTQNAYNGYIYLATSGKELPQSTHADRYNLNMAYGISAYNKGEVFLAQLGYVIGEENLKKTLKEYYNHWQFKHPTPNDFIRIAEQVSALELEWYLTDWTMTTNTIDYAVKSVNDKSITLERIGLMAMPIDLIVEYENGKTEEFYIPLQMMRGEKPTKATIIKDWSWSHPTYTFNVNSKVKKVTIDAKNKMADINKENNTK